MADIRLVVQDSVSWKAAEISTLTSSITWSTSLIDQPGKLEFEYIRNETVFFGEGSRVSLIIDGKGYFYGYVFTRKRNETGRVSITAYDQLRYLQNKDIKVFESVTCSQMFSQICAEQQLKCSVLHASPYVIPPVIHDNKSYFQMIQDAIDATLTNTGRWYAIRDNFGVLEHVDLAMLKVGLLVGDASLLTGYEYETSIDSETANQVKLVKDNKETQKRDVYIERDSSTIQRWGLLQHFEVMDEKANEAQIIQRAQMLLRLKNRPTRRLKLSALGNLRVREGVGIGTAIRDLEAEGVGSQRFGLVKSCEHEFRNGLHKMTLEIEVA